jgi:diacylglycerol kinase family enzyme
MDLLKFEDLTQTTQTRAIYAMSNVDWGCTVAAVANSKQMSKVFGSSARTIAIVGGVLKNASYPAAIEIPQSEAPSEYVNFLAQERDYHCINVYHSKTIIMGSQSIRVNASAQLDDGLMELMVKRFGSRGDFSKSMKRMVLTGEQTSAYATEDSWNSMVQVSSLIVRPASSGTGKCHMGSNSVIVDRDIVGGSPYRISVAPRALKLFV